MAMNKKAQMALVNMMVAIVVIIFAFQFINPIKDEVITGRDADHLNCTSADISTGQKMSCIAVDLYLPLFIILCLAGAGGYLIGKKIIYNYQPPQQ
jgi:hypothetical protein